MFTSTRAFGNSTVQDVAERSISSFESKIWLLRREVLRILAERHICDLQQTLCHAITNIQLMVCTADNFTAFRTRTPDRPNEAIVAISARAGLCSARLRRLLRQL